MGDVFGGRREEAEAIAMIGALDFGGFELVDVLDGEHGDEVIDLGKMRERGATDALGGGIGIVEFGMGLL